MRSMERYGAEVERGEIIEARGELPEREYKVKSLSRDGVTTPFMRAICGSECWDKFEAKASVPGVGEVEVKVKCKLQYEAGQKVYYCMFDDGRGRVLAAIED